jgi:glutamate synthase (NADPH/NADH) large chain
MPEPIRDMFSYCNSVMEPWDGPAAICGFAGNWVIAAMDRNGLRPLRYAITEDGLLVAGSEAGMVKLNENQIRVKGRLGPGQMLALDLSTGTLLENKDIDELLKERHPYKAWLNKGISYLHADLVDPSLAAEPFDRETLAVYQKMFNLTAEERDEVVKVLARD